MEESRCVNCDAALYEPIGEPRSPVRCVRARAGALLSACGTPSRSMSTVAEPLTDHVGHGSDRHREPKPAVGTTED